MSGQDHRCDHCGRYAAGLVHCETCGAEVCPDCTVVCAGCGASVCLDCVNHVGRVHEQECPRCRGAA